MLDTVLHKIHAAIAMSASAARTCSGGGIMMPLEDPVAVELLLELQQRLRQLLDRVEGGTCQPHMDSQFKNNIYLSAR